MYKFNNDSIVTGYIKQLLHTFNLPRCKIFKSESDLLNTYPAGAAAFGIIKKYKDNRDCIVYLRADRTIEVRGYYLYNKYYQNLTSNFGLFNSLYDTDCHKYLGEYLRFIRDFSGLNLMSMYNCFSNEILVGKTYKYIIVPVKNKTDYTIAFTGSNYKYVFTYKSKLEDIENIFVSDQATEYKDVKTTSSTFNKPFKLTSSIGADKTIETGSRVGQKKYAIFNESNYKLVIRIGVNDNDVITVLEGDYSKRNQFFVPIQANYDKELDDKNYDNVDIDQYMSDLQLLDYHLRQNNVNYPFADRLIEYLTDMVILPSDRISNNIIEAKYKVYERYGNNGDEPTQTRKTLGVLNSSFKNIDRLRFLDAFSQTKYQYKNSYDLLGYVDKEIEECLDDETRNPVEEDS